MSQGVKGDIFIVGSGKMARDLGLFFWQTGYGVTWLSGDEKRLFDTEVAISKKRARLEKMLGSDISAGRCRFSRLGEAHARGPDVVIETGSEDLDKKRAAITALMPSLRDDTLVLSNSSSLKSETISPQCIGMHFFHPVTLTLFAELIFPDRCPSRTREMAVNLARDLGLSYVVQGSQNAFAMNRLLLPLQAELFRSYLLGHGFKALDAGSVSPLLSVGQVKMMNEIGLDILSAAVHNYTLRMAPEASADFLPLASVLDRLVQAEYLGKKNRRDLFKAEAEAETRPALIEAWQAQAQLKTSPEGCPLDRRLAYLFINTCLSFLERGECDAEDLSVFLSSVLGAEISLQEAVESEGPAAIHHMLEYLYTETGISYFMPSGLLDNGARSEVL